MIRLTVKVKNDHCNLTEHFECESLVLSVDDEYFKSLIKSVVDKFNQPVEEVIVKARMEV